MPDCLVSPHLRFSENIRVFVCGKELVQRTKSGEGTLVGSVDGRSCLLQQITFTSPPVESLHSVSPDRSCPLVPGFFSILACSFFAGSLFLLQCDMPHSAQRSAVLSAARHVPLIESGPLSADRRCTYQRRSKSASHVGHTAAFKSLSSTKI